MKTYIVKVIDMHEYSCNEITQYILSIANGLQLTVNCNKNDDFANLIVIDTKTNNGIKFILSRENLNTFNNLANVPMLDICYVYKDKSIKRRRQQHATLHEVVNIIEYINIKKENNNYGLRN